MKSLHHYNLENNIFQVKKELSSFPFMNKFVPADMLIGLYNFSNLLISIREIERKNTVADVT